MARIPTSTSQASAALGPGPLAIALAVNLAFALNIIAMKVVVDATAPLVSVALRMTLTFAVCLPWFRPVPGRNLLLGVYGALNGGLFLLILNLALRMASNVGALAIAGQLSVPFSLLLAVVVLRERLTPRRAAGVVLAFGGVVLLVFDKAIVGEIPAVLVMALAALIWASGTLVQRWLSGIHVLNTQAWNGLMGMVLLAPLALAFEGDTLGRLTQMHAVVIGWFAFTVLGATIAGQGALAWLLARFPLASVMPLMLASPVMATLLSSLYFGTPITPVMIVGGLVAVAGVAVISLRPPARLPPIAETD